VPFVPHLAGARVGQTPDVDVEFRVGGEEEGLLEFEKEKRRHVRIRLGGRRNERVAESVLTLKGKKRGNQLSISGETRCIRSGWIERPMSPYRWASKYPLQTRRVGRQSESAPHPKKRRGRIARTQVRGGRQREECGKSSWETDANSQYSNSA
jgi:hypothetical protein